MMNESVAEKPHQAMTESGCTCDKRARAVSTGHVVEDYYIGKTHIKICDDYCRTKTPEEVDAILRHIASWTRDSLIAAEARKEKQ